MTRGEELRARLAAGDHGAVLTLLGDFAFLEERCRDSIDALLDDLGFVLRRAPAPLPAQVSLVHPSGARLDRDVIARVEAILDGARADLARDAALLFPLLYNELFWHDAPERAAHHDGPAAPATDRQLWRWMESWRATSGAPWLRTLRPPAIPRAAVTSWRAAASVRSISPDGTRMLVRTDALLLVDARTGTVRATVSSVANADGRFARDGDLFVVRVGTSVQLWSGEPPKPGADLGPHAHDVGDVVFSCDGHHIITRARNELRVFEVADGTCIATRKLQGSASRILPCAGGVLVHDGKSWRHWDYVRDQMGRTRFAGYADWTAVTPFGDLMVTVENSELSCWTFPDAKAVFAIPAEGSAIAFHPSGDSFAMRAHSGWVAVRDATTGAEIRQIRSTEVASLTYDPTGRYLVLERSWGPSRLWDVAASRVAAEIHAPSRAGSRVMFSHDGKVLALGVPESTTIVDLTSLVPLVHWRDDGVVVGEYSSGYFSPSGETLVVTDKQLAFWDVERGVIRRQFDARAVTRFDRGSRVLGRCGDALVALATEDGEEVWRAMVPTSDHERVTAADAARLLVHSDPQHHRVIGLGMDDGKERYRIDGETVALCEGDVMVTRTRAGDVALRGVERGDERLKLAALGGDTYALSPDRRWLAVHGSVLEIWDLTTRTRAHTVPSSGSTSFSFRSDSAALETSRWQSQQSGNQDLLEEAAYDVHTGACVGSSSTWENDLPVTAREIATGVVLDGGALHVAGVSLMLPRDPIVTCTRSGTVIVASVRGGRVELYALHRTIRPG